VSTIKGQGPPDVDAAPFIDYMLSVIRHSLLAYESMALLGTMDGGIYGGTNGGINEAVIALLRRDSSLTVADIAARIGKSRRTIERTLHLLRAEGRLRREGSNKTGSWVVVQKE